MADSNDLLLEVKDLRTHFFTDEGVVKAVDGVTLSVRRGRTLGVVGESGCGKSVTARSILQIVDRPGHIIGGQILYHRRPTTDDQRRTGLTPASMGTPGRGGSRTAPTPLERGPGGEDQTPSSQLPAPSSQTIDLARLHPRSKEIRRIRGKDIAMIFQEPMASLSPVHTIGTQLVEAILLHQPVTKAEARLIAIDMLGKVGIPLPGRRIDEYPHQLSGGMRQRAMIAIALSCNPALLIADEPTTALDVTTQAQILDLLAKLKDELGMSIMLITHDLGVVAEMADDVAVMYLGKVVERADVDSLFHDPKHPYTRALLRSIPKLGQKARERLETIRGMVPHPFNRPPGCLFHPRCPSFMPGICDQREPVSVPVAPDREAACFLYNQ